MPSTLESINFDNRTVRSLPMDKETKTYVRSVPGACFSWVEPTPCENPQTVAYSLPAMKLLDLDKEQLLRPEFPEYMSGNKILPGSQTAAHCYCGHQFGVYAGQLGDGAAMYLGEVVNSKGERWEIQLKGAGLTPYSRSADGRKVLRSSLREFLCSEAMYHLGIPTTRAGCCIVSDSTVIRDIFYDGHPKHENCSIVLRIAETFLRIGSFEICKEKDEMSGRIGPSVGRIDVLTELLNYTVKYFYPEVDENFSDPHDKYMEMYKQLVVKTAKLSAMWQCVGFCHGVLNTDNTSIVGLTIDYGPFGFMDRFDPDYACNGSDDGGRYTYKNQPKMLRWNLQKFAEALDGIIPMSKLLPFLEQFDVEYNDYYLEIMRKKVGLLACEPCDRKLVDDLLETMYETGADFTNSFRCLSSVNFIDDGDYDHSKAKLIQALLNNCCSLEELINTSKPSLSPQQMMMFSLHPQLLHMLGSTGQAISRELAKHQRYQQLKEMKPDDKKRKDERLWTLWIDKYIERIKNDVKNHSSRTDWNQSRIKLMNLHNPKFILRNYIAQRSIENAEKGDYSEVKMVLKMLEDPYVKNEPEEKVLNQESSEEASAGHVLESSIDNCKNIYSKYFSPPPKWAHSLKVT